MSTIAREVANTLCGVQTFSLVKGDLVDLSADRFPTTVSAWQDDSVRLVERSTHFGYVHQGPANLTGPWGTFGLTSGMYFSLNAAGAIDGSGSGIVVSRLGYRGFFHVGGPIEPSGRLRYIDGCTDSLLISPVQLGDPCLNLLCIPPGTDQTAHTHPSHRIGLIARGRGRCLTPDCTIPLIPGSVFLIPADQLHCFHTDTEELTIVTYHPDSDFGPTHENHPMLNRTIIPTSIGERETESGDQVEASRG